MSVWGWVALSVSLLGIGGYLWYNLRQIFAAESDAVADRAIADAADKKASQLEAQRLADETAAAERDKRDGDSIVSSSDRARAIGFLRDSFPEGSHDSN